MDEKLKIVRVVKELYEREGSDWSLTQQQFISEIRVFKELQHPYIPKILDVYTNHGKLMLVMEHVEGIDLHHYIEKNGVADEQTVIRWGKQIVEIMLYLHQKNPPILHLDLKPSNIILHNSGHLYLIDFGIALCQRQMKKESTGEKSEYFIGDRIESGADKVFYGDQKESGRRYSMGSRFYAAPEQFFADGTIDVRTDIYGLGKTLLFCMYGSTEVVESLDKESSPLVHFLKKCVAQSMDDRWISMDEVKRELERLAESTLGASLAYTVSEEEVESEWIRSGNSSEQYIGGREYPGADKEGSYSGKPKVGRIFDKFENGRLSDTSSGDKYYRRTIIGLMIGICLIVFSIRSMCEYMNRLEMKTTLTYARESLDEKVKLEYYKKALEVDPSMKEIYDCLIEDYLQHHFNVKKASTLLNLLEETGALISLFQEDKITYATFCYEMAKGFYYMDNYDNGEKESRLWLGRSKEALMNQDMNSLESEEGDMIQHLSEYIEEMENIIEAGESDGVE